MRIIHFSETGRIDLINCDKLIFKYPHGIHRLKTDYFSQLLFDSPIQHVNVMRIISYFVFIIIPFKLHSREMKIDALKDS